TQNDKTVTYISRQPENDLKVQYSDFENFTTNQIELKIESAEISSENPLEISSSFKTNQVKMFSPVEHSFSDIDEEFISIDPPEKIESISKITIPATVYTDTFLE